MLTDNRLEEFTQPPVVPLEVVEEPRVVVQRQHVHALVPALDAQRGRGRGGRAAAGGRRLVALHQRVPPLVEVSRRYVVDRDAYGSC